VGIRVVVVDDQELVRTGFRMILSAEPDIDVVGEADDGAQALELVERAQPDVVLMDVRMPVMDGVEATGHIVSRRPADGCPQVLILTTFDLDEYVFSALRAGASGFLLKDTPAEDLVEAVRVIAAGDALLSPSVTRRVIGEFAAQQPPGPRPGGAHSDVDLTQLTEREAEVLVHIAKGLSNAEIGEALFVSETTVKTHVGRVLMKLHLRDRVQAVVLAYETGLVRPSA
jgi:DNA-binding NarL/FixJ family response regulator